MGRILDNSPWPCYICPLMTLILPYFQQKMLLSLVTECNKNSLPNNKNVLSHLSTLNALQDNNLNGSKYFLFALEKTENLNRKRENIFTWVPSQAC